jgi:hypothetical protein
MDTHAHIIASVVPDVYSKVRQVHNLHPNIDLSRSRHCAELTSELWHRLTSRGIEVRRELHQANGLWHFVIAHTAPGVSPANTDLITDLNPWYHEIGLPYTGHLHGSRPWVEAQLRITGTPENYIALRGIKTITHAHTT